MDNKKEDKMKRIIFGLIFLGIIFLTGCSTLTTSEKLAWDNYFKQMEKTHQVATKFLLENPNTK